MKKVINVGLLKDEEIDIPAKNYVYDSLPKNLEICNVISMRWVMENCDEENFAGKYKVNLYIKGKIAAPLLASLIAACSKKGIELSIFYYSYYTNEYNEQVIF